MKKDSEETETTSTCQSTGKLRPLKPCQSWVQLSFTLRSDWLILCPPTPLSPYVNNPDDFFSPTQHTHTHICSIPACCLRSLKQQITSTHHLMTAISRGVLRLRGHSYSRGPRGFLTATWSE